MCQQVHFTQTAGRKNEGPRASQSPPSSQAVPPESAPSLAAGPGSALGHLRARFPRRGRADSGWRQAERGGAAGQAPPRHAPSLQRSADKSGRPGPAHPRGEPGPPALLALQTSQGLGAAGQRLGRAPYAHGPAAARAPTAPEAESGRGGPGPKADLLVVQGRGKGRYPNEVDCGEVGSLLGNSKPRVWLHLLAPPAQSPGQTPPPSEGKRSRKVGSGARRSQLCNPGVASLTGKLLARSRQLGSLAAGGRVSWPAADPGAEPASPGASPPSDTPRVRFADALCAPRRPLAAACPAQPPQPESGRRG